VQLQAPPHLDRNGNRVDIYVNDFLGVLGCIKPEVVVEVGVGVGHVLKAASSFRHASYLGVDLFQRDSPVDQLEECQANLRNTNVHLLKAPGDFPARAYPERHVDLLHLDIFDVEPTEHTLRYMLQAWSSRYKFLVVPNEPLFEEVVGGEAKGAVRVVTC